jgi:hypothetical protein
MIRRRTASRPGRAPAGITTADTTGIAARLASTPYAIATCSLGTLSEKTPPPVCRVYTVDCERGIEATAPRSLFRALGHFYGQDSFARVGKLSLLRIWTLLNLPETGASFPPVSFFVSGKLTAPVGQETEILRARIA